MVLPEYNPLRASIVNVPNYGESFNENLQSGVRSGLALRGIPQQIAQNQADAGQLENALRAGTLPANISEAALRNKLTQEQIQSLPVERQLAILKGITESSPGFVNPGQPGSTMPMYPSEGVEGGPSGATLRNAVPTGGAGVPASDIQDRQIQDMNAQTPSDTVPLNFPGMPPIPYSPSKEAQYKMLMMTAPFRKLDYADQIAQRKENRIRKPTTNVSAEPDSWGQPIVTNERGQQFVGDSNEPFSGRRQSASLASYVDPKALEGALNYFHTKGELPSFGFGQSALRAQVLARLGDPNVDLTNEAAVNAAQIKGLQSAYTNQQKIATGTEAALNTFDKQMNLAESLSQKVDRTGVPVFNRWLNNGRMALAGDTDVTNFHNAVNGGANEYAKIIEGSAGSIQGASPASLIQAQDRITDAFTKGTFTSVKDLMKVEGKLKLDGYKSALQERVNDMKALGATPGKTSDNTQSKPSSSQTPTFGSEQEAEFYAKSQGWTGGEPVVINGKNKIYQP